MSVRFKFKNDLDYQPIPCDGFHISVRDLKRAIIRLKKFGKVTDFDLVVTNSQTLHVYLDDEELISKNTTLTVQRAPLGEGKKKVGLSIIWNLLGVREGRLIRCKVQKELPSLLIRGRKGA